MNRQEYNYEILNYLRYTYPLFNVYYDNIEMFIKKFPQQRFGQIICNYIFPDYRETPRSSETSVFMELIFNIDIDPFFEESSETFKRLTE